MKTARELTEMICMLGHDERLAFEIAITRVLEGRRVYGQLIVDADPRDFVHEAVQEAIDGMFYLAVQLVRLDGSRRLKPTPPDELIEVDAKPAEALPP